MSRQWTAPQWDAIHAEGGALLVSAAAGSGKTAVLVERAVRLIVDAENPVDADRLMIATFTNAAAAEMKQRIGARLSALIRERPMDVRLQRQQALLARASIGTVHSFCLGLVRENFQHLPVTPDFTLADEGELTVLREEVARELIEEYYAQDESGVFSALVELLSSGRDDSKMVETMLRVWEFARSHPFPARWLERMRALYDGTGPVSETLWGSALLEHAQDTLGYCVHALASALELCEADTAVDKAYGNALRSDLQQARQCLALAQAEEWDAAVAALRAFRFERLGALRGNESAKLRVKGVRERCKKSIGELGERVLSATGEQFREDMADLKPKVNALFDLTQEFGRRFAARKVEKKRMDFSDLEHFALQLLVEPDGDGWRRTEQARQLAEHYATVLVDEYQDTNEVQDLIFTSVSREEENLFFVGDAKQSIYSFRLAMPQIFLGKKDAYAAYNGQTFPARIALDTNFRSRAEVTDAVNDLFSMTMSRALGDIDYEGDERLQCGAAYPEYDGAMPELLLLATKDYVGERDAVALEADLVARKIRDMLRDGYRVRDGEGMRPCRPGDFCVLMRSPRGRTDAYVKALKRYGIGSWAQNAGGYLQAREVSMVLSLLRALDNPLLDVPLVAALTSPLFGFTDEEIAAIRLCERSVPFYLALYAAAQEGKDIAKAAHFLEVFDELRRLAAVLSADRLLLEVLERTDALAVAQAMPMGETRRLNLLQLVEYAATYHALGYKRLGGFLGFLDSLTERGGDLAPAGVTGEGADAVRVMSVHRSKGLEFPIVILADLAKQFNRSDLYQNTRLHSQYGFACARRDPATMKQFATVPMQAIRLAGERSLLSEELRVLYVALTRAKEKLILTYALKTDPTRKLGGLFGEARDGKLPARLVAEARCPGDWLLMTLLHHPDGQALRDAAGLSDEGWLSCASRWKVALLEPPDEEAGEESTALPRTAAPDPALRALLRERAAWRYPLEALTRVPTKMAVSAVAKGAQAAAHRFTARPKFLREREMSGAERGNALHAFMQYCDYNEAKEDLLCEIERLRELRFLTPAQADSLDVNKLTTFFEGSLAARLFASDKVWRELKFMYECGQDMLGDFLPDLPDGATVALQGVADCVFVENEQAFVVDYKSDYVKTPDQLLERYAGQLTLYRRMLERILPVPVGGCILYSFALNAAIDVAPSLYK